MTTTIELHRLITLTKFFPSPAKSEKLNPAHIPKIWNKLNHHRRLPEARNFSPNRSVVISFEKSIMNAEKIKIPILR
jgi:hypothetical protein